MRRSKMVLCCEACPTAGSLRQNCGQKGIKSADEERLFKHSAWSERKSTIDVKTRVQFHRKHLRRLTSFLPLQRPARHHSRPAASRSQISEWTPLLPFPNSNKSSTKTLFQTIHSLLLVPSKREAGLDNLFYASCHAPTVDFMQASIYSSASPAPVCAFFNAHRPYSYQVCGQRECFLERHRVTAFAKELQRTCTILLLLSLIIQVLYCRFVCEGLHSCRFCTAQFSLLCSA
ncbi:unnamed protein product [Cercospora beticola]|nr:unnamed protein product [Cercospora beticola]